MESRFFPHSGIFHSGLKQHLYLVESRRSWRIRAANKTRVREDGVPQSSICKNIFIKVS
jgi:hypothetical protein